MFWVFSSFLGLVFDICFFTQAKFPEFFAGLEKRTTNNRSGDFYDATDFWNDAQVAAKKVTEIREFLKRSGVKDLEKVGIDSVGFSREGVREVEEGVESAYREAGGEEKGKSVVVRNVPRQVCLFFGFFVRMDFVLRV